MNKKRLLFLLLMVLCLWPMNHTSAESERFKKALPGYDFVFPRDHGNHPDYLIEWWYFTGNLTSSQGDAFGYELTFFRRGIENKHADQNPSKWLVRDIYLAHFAITDVSEKNFYYDEKISRKALGKAGAESGQMRVWIDDWSVIQDGQTILLSAGNAVYKINLKLTPEKPLVIHGESGISKKGEASGAASHYYSFTRLLTEGKLIVAGDEKNVTGLSWMDHEFGSSLLGEGQIGWDWFSIQLDDGSEYMFYQIRQNDGGKDPISSGTVIYPDGQKKHLNATDFKLKPTRYWKSKKSGATYPVAWEISVPSEQLILKSLPVLDHQELITDKSTRVSYWEGASKFKGKKNGVAVSGKGYIELTGYDRDLED